MHSQHASSDIAAHGSSATLSLRNVLAIDLRLHDGTQDVCRSPTENGVAVVAPLRRGADEHLHSLLVHAEAAAEHSEQQCTVVLVENTRTDVVRRCGGQGAEEGVRFAAPSDAPLCYSAFSVLVVESKASTDERDAHDVWVLWGDEGVSLFIIFLLFFINFFHFLLY